MESDPILEQVSGLSKLSLELILSLRGDDILLGKPNTPLRQSLKASRPFCSKDSLPNAITAILICSGLVKIKASTIG